MADLPGAHNEPPFHPSCRCVMPSQREHATDAVRDLISSNGCLSDEQSDEFLRRIRGAPALIGSLDDVSPISLGPGMVSASIDGETFHDVGSVSDIRIVVDPAVSDESVFLFGTRLSPQEIVVIDRAITRSSGRIRTEEFNDLARRHLQPMPMSSFSWFKKPELLVSPIPEVLFICSNKKRCPSKTVFWSDSAKKKKGYLCGDDVSFKCWHCHEVQRGVYFPVCKRKLKI
jgi:hypothetical protein